MKSNGQQTYRPGPELQRPLPACTWYHSTWKRAFDVVAATLLLILLLPLMLLVALVVKLTSPGPVLFRQRRPGQGGREFYILKFRTMIDGGHRAGPAFTRPCDPRITPCGNFMRKWKLDELPQLLNVIRGQMSFVGPRPLPSSHWEQAMLLEDAACVLSVRPGITSEVTLNFRNEEQLLSAVGSEEVGHLYLTGILPLKMEMEARALQNGSFGRDLRIMLKTVLRVFRQRGVGEEQVIRERLLGIQAEPYASLREPVQQEEFEPASEPGD
ncbi:MAG TPA: sugar transferase [Terriglobales bacterium]|nr:sugar transferase [Terriglobales bacterium]